MRTANNANVTNRTWFGEGKNNNKVVPAIKLSNMIIMALTWIFLFSFSLYILRPMIVLRSANVTKYPIISKFTPPELEGGQDNQQMVYIFEISTPRYYLA